MSETHTLGSRAKVRWDKPDRLNPARVEKDMVGILELVIEVRRSFEEALDLSAYGSRGEQLVLGRGFSDSNPTEAAATAPTRRQARRAAARAATLVDQARQTLQEAADVLFNGVKRTEPEEFAEFIEKRRAVLDGAEDGAVRP